MESDLFIVVGPRERTDTDFQIQDSQLKSRRLLYKNVTKCSFSYRVLHMNGTFLDTVMRRRTRLSLGHEKFQEAADSFSSKMYILVEKKNLCILPWISLQLISKDEHRHKKAIREIFIKSGGPQIIICERH